MVDLHTLILNLRPDLRNRYGFDLAPNRERFTAWLITTGCTEYQSVIDDAELGSLVSGQSTSSRYFLSNLQRLVLLARPDVKMTFPLPAKRMEFLDWFYTHGVEECGFWPFLTDVEKRQILGYPEPWASRLRAVIHKQTPAQKSALPLSNRKFGVNVIGYAFGQLGIGEDMRMAARALRAAKVPMTMLDFPPGPDVSQNDRSMAKYVSDKGEFAVNLFCMTAEEHGRFYAEHGRAQFKDRYTIGYWPWELGKWPKFWEMMLDLVDEVWVSTQHTYDALAPVCSKPLFVMPMAVQVEKVKSFASRSLARKHFGLPEKAKLFCFAFDLNSHMGRKNPQACLDAFLKAFPRKAKALDSRLRGNDDEAQVGLVIKVSKPGKANKAWEKLKALAAKDSRIHIIEGTLQRPELLALYKTCDCFLSLHRAEGFGRGMAEALQLGLHVICTGYSGNVDFCRPPYADLVRYKLVKVRKSEYVHTEGQVWAEPDIAHAARLMQKFVKEAPRRKKLKWPEFSAKVVGQRYKKRLEQIRRTFKEDIELAGNQL